MKCKFDAGTASAALCLAALSDAFWECAESGIGFSSLPLHICFTLTMALTAALMMRWSERAASVDIRLAAALSAGALFCLVSDGEPRLRLIFSAVTLAFLVPFGKDSNETEYSAETARFAEIEERYERSRELWHDMRSHTAVISDYAARGDCEGMRVYTEKFCGELERAILPYRTGSRAADAALSDSLGSAKRHNINVDINIEPLDRLRMAPADICTVISNLVANAVDANLALEEGERYIRIAARRNGESVFFNIENPYTENAPEKSGTNHGLGLRSAERAVHKYGGMLAVTAKNGVFRAAAELM